MNSKRGICESVTSVGGDSRLFTFNKQVGAIA